MIFCDGPYDVVVMFHAFLKKPHLILLCVRLVRIKDLTGANCCFQRELTQVLEVPAEQLDVFHSVDVESNIEGVQGDESDDVGEVADDLCHCDYMISR